MSRRAHALAALALATGVVSGVASAEPRPATGRPLRLDEAIALALANNDAVVIQRESVVVAESAELGARGAYDPSLEIQADYRQSQAPVNSPFSGAPPPEPAPTFKTTETFFSLTQLLSTGGTLALRADAIRQSTDGNFVLLSPAWETRLGVEFRQPLLRGRAIDTPRLGLRVTAADRDRAGAALRRELSDTVASVEAAYWSLVAAHRAVGVQEESVRLAEAQLSETRVRAAAGAVPQNEISQPTAELERRRGELFETREILSRAENLLKLLILDAGDAAAWAAPIFPEADPGTPVEPVAVEAALERALTSRPELQESAAELEQRRARAALAQDSVKPGLDAFVSYDRFGLAGSVDLDPNTLAAFPTLAIPGYLEGGLGQSLETLGEGYFDDARAGLVMSLPLGNRAAKGAEGVALAQERQAEAALSAVKKRIQAEVLDAAATVRTTAQRIDASRASREAAEVQLASEQDRYSVGLSTNFLVLTRQNDLSRARLSEIEAQTDYRRARTRLARATGSLLEERRINVE